MDQTPSSPAKKDLKDKSVPELIMDLTGGVSDLVRAEIELAKSEARKKAGLAGQGAGLFFGAAIAAVMFFFTATALIIIALDLAMPLWLAALIVTAFWLVLAVVLALIGKARFSRLETKTKRS